MVEHEVCNGCKNNNYPECLGTKMFNGNYMNIENLRPGFQCGQKDTDNITDFSIEVKSDLQLKIDDLQEQINNLKSV